MMQDWLNEKKLDRKLLANLAANLAAAEAYQQFCAMEVAGVLREVLDAVEDEEGGPPLEGGPPEEGGPLAEGGLLTEEEGEEPPSAQEEAQTMAQAPLLNGGPPDRGAGRWLTQRCARPHSHLHAACQQTATPQEGSSAFLFASFIAFTNGNSSPHSYRDPH